MTTRVSVTRGEGNHPLEVVNNNGDVVAVLEKSGDEFSDNIHSGSNEQYTVREKKDS